MKDTAGIEFLDAADASWLDRNWMWISAAIGAVTAFFLFAHDRTLSRQHWYGLLLSCVYAVHQVEEHGCDIFGRYYMFVPIFNKSVASRIGVAVTARGATYINLISIWISFPVCVYLSTPENLYMPAAISWGTAVVNGLTGHLIPLVNEYIPGAVQSIFMVPFGLRVLVVIFSAESGWFRGVVIPLVVGVVFHLVALIAPFALFEEGKGAGGELTVPAFQILGGIVIPCVVSSLAKNLPNEKQL